MITPELKDKVLNILLESNSMTSTINIERLSREIECPYDVVEGILDYFERKGLVANKIGFINGDLHITLNVEASDMALRGGFVAQEELIKKNFEKLLLELDSLQSKFPEKIKTITTIATNILTALNMFRT